MQTTRIASAERGELEALGQAIRHVRRQQNLSTGDLACTLGIARQRLVRIEAGREDPGYKLLRATARALNTTSSALLALAETLDEPAASTHGAADTAAALAELPTEPDTA
jgi:transcriptional regulator with XRE-family HTH domain